ncbi:uncharacterized protein LOC127378407 isoform X6 [Dicentrarchus labrax]|uniref:uncharacterized protein LOC127378407 isoform X6 n=1 Tax=Dicentrarchus labrax TaxID=13489 RepID=UPI0021F594E0|nr:uncharacterized protein LOC127378407 isoform X6 [Dicentrarchus labrax]
MGRWKHWFVVLLPLIIYIGSTATVVNVVKTIGSKPDVTSICTNDTLRTITLIVCKIRTQMGGEECRLLYRHGKDFEHDCDSRFTLMMDNQTVFLHLTSLTAEDSGNYICDCSRLDGTYSLHLNITVEEDEDPDSTTGTEISLVNIGLGIGVFIFIIITGVILGVIFRKIHHRNCSRSATSGLSVCETPGSLDQDDTDDLYTSLQQPESDLYQTISNPASKLVTVPIDNQEIIRGETDSSCVLTETVAADGCWP